MEYKREKTGLSKVYYVPGSGLIPIPVEQMGEVPELRNEYHEQEVRNAVLFARCRRMV